MSQAAHRIDPSAMLDMVQIERELGRRSLRQFTRLAWDTVQPGQGDADEFGRYWARWGWHLDAVCDHFEAFIRGDILRLIVNIPPRSTKSTVGSVCAPVWGWIDNPALQFLTASYRDDLSTRDSVRSRRLIQSPWFQDRWGEDSFTLWYDQNRKTRYENNKGGHRIAQSVSGGSTGEGGDRIIVDDPHNVKRAESDVERQNAIDWWDEEMQSRLNDAQTGGLCIIMQRLHERDLTGHVLNKEAGFVHLKLPMRHEVDDKGRSSGCITTWPGFRFEDPRTIEGESLDPKRFPEPAIADLEKRMNPYAIAGQLQQRPAPRKGGMFEVDLIEIVSAPPAGISRMVRYWDKAGTDRAVAKATGSHTAGLLIGKITAGIFKDRYIFLDAVRGQWSAGKREQIIRSTAEKDGKGVTVGIEQEPGSGGKESAEATVKNLEGFKSYIDRVTGDKETRAEPMASQMMVGNCMMLKADWNDQFIHELRMFPVGAQKDQVDAASGAFNKLASMRGKRLTW